MKSSRLLYAWILLFPLLLSCPNPIDEKLLRIVEDEIPPELVILSPLPNSLYSWTVTVEGILTDSSQKSGDRQGGLKSLSLAVLPRPELNRVITFNASGTANLDVEDPAFRYDSAEGRFHFELSMLGIADPLYFTFTATDLNGNTTERMYSISADPTKGPYLVLSEPVNLSSYGVIVDILGSVTNAPADPQTSNVASLSWEVPGTGRTGELQIAGSSPDPADGKYKDADESFVFDPSTGAFSDSFMTIGLKNTLGFVFRAFDRGGRKSEAQAQLLDPNTGPQVTITDHDQYYSSAATASSMVSGTVSDPLNVQSMSYIVKQIIGAPRSGAITGFGGGNFSFTFDISGLSGRLTVEVYAVDMAGRGAGDPAKTFDMYDDPYAPAISQGTLAADNSYIDVTFNEAAYSLGGLGVWLESSDFDLHYQPNGSSANVTVGAVTRTDGSALTGGETSVRVTLSRTGPFSGVETINVTPVNGSTILDHVGNPMPVTSATGLKVLHDQQVPGVDYVDSTKLDGAYGAGTSIVIRVQFTENVAVAGGTPTLALNTGGTATFLAVSGSILSLGYAVSAGHNSADLEYSGVDALELNGATIQDASGNAITSVVLPASGSGNSLGDRKNLVIDTTAPSAPGVSIDDVDGWIGISENAAGVPFTLTGEAGADYTITPTNCTVNLGNTGTLPKSGLKLVASGSGPVRISVVLRDAAGNASLPSQDDSTADLVKPSDPVVAIVDGDGYIDDVENAAGVSFTITGEADMDYTITPTNCAVNLGNTGTLPVSGLKLTASGNGTVVITVMLKDSAGNTSNTISDSSIAYITAPDPPTVSIADGDGKINISENNAWVPFTISGEAGTAYTVTSTTNCTVSSGTGTLPASGLELQASDNGDVSLSVRLRHIVGPSSTPGTDSSVADLEAPTVGVDFLSTNEHRPALSGTVDDTAATILVTVDGNSYPATNDGDGTWSLASGIVSSLSHETYDVQAAATDTAGNVGTDATSNELVITP